jgi:hypothetical protein
MRLSLLKIYNGMLKRIIELLVLGKLLFGLKLGANQKPIIEDEGKTSINQESESARGTNQPAKTEFSWKEYNLHIRVSTTE